jgi:hypothetical protein
LENTNIGDEQEMPKERRIKSYGEFEMCEQMTVGELRERLQKYPDDTIIFMEASNSANHGDTLWSQRLLDAYTCDDVIAKKESLMLVGNLR